MLENELVEHSSAARSGEITLKVHNVQHKFVGKTMP
jgi:hypothetical protein